MKLALCVLLVCVTVIFADENELEHGQRGKRGAPYVASVAERYVGSTGWSKAGCIHNQCGKWKYNYFVADMLIEAGKSYAKSPKRGDIAAYVGDAGIVTRYGETVSATEYSVVRNYWGFRPGQSPVFLEHTCKAKGPSEKTLVIKDILLRKKM